MSRAAGPGGLELEGHALAGRPGLGETDVGRSSRLDHEAGELLRPNQPDGAQVDDRLEDDGEAAPAEDGPKASLERHLVGHPGMDDVGDEGGHGLVVDPGVRHPGPPQGSP